MNGEAVTDLILRAIAAMRELGEFPEMETPEIKVARVTNASVETFHSNAGQAIAAAQTGEQPHLSAQAFARAVADYLSEVVDLVPAYHEVASVTSTDDGSLIITLRSAETP